jgi:hypothetical protein
VDYLKRLEKFDKLEQKRFKKIHEINNRALTKHANKWAKYRVIKIAQNLVLSNTISLKELTQLDIQHKTMSEICEFITKKFGKTRLEHLDNDMISILSEMDDYERGELIDLSSITRKQLGKDSRGIIDVVKVKEMEKSFDEKLEFAIKTNDWNVKEPKVKSTEDMMREMMSKARKGIRRY